MTTVLFFQDLARTTWKWRFANSLRVPNHISVERWAEAHNNFYGLNRGNT